MRLSILLILLLFSHGCEYQNSRVSDDSVFVFINSAATVDTGKALDKNVIRDQVILHNKVKTADTVNNGSCTMTPVQQELLAAHNQARSVGRNCGTMFYPPVNPLSWDCTLAEISDEHNQDMANNNFFDHTGSNGLRVADRATNAGYNWQTVGENIAAGYQDVDAVMQGWLESPGHCANIMRAQFSDLGSDLYNAFGSQYPTYWTAAFGRKSNF